jgi:glutamine amidotransferase
MERVIVIDYGMGNLRSVAKALEHVALPGQQIAVSGRGEDVRAADRVVFPGQGAIRDCMGEIRQLGLEQAVREAAAARPFLGICMGLQALMQWSEEDPGTPGLGLLSGGVRRFPGGTDPDTGETLKIPHMGWNRVTMDRPHPVWGAIPSGERFYFVHSYFVDPEDPAVVAGRCRYGVAFVCAVAYRNVFAVQFHPEKSQHAGLELLRNFLRWEGSAA